MLRASNLSAVGQLLRLQCRRASYKSSKRKRRVEAAPKQEADWERQLAVNPFVRNTGGARQLKHMDLDPQDHEIMDTDLLRSHALGNDVSNLMNMSKHFRKEMKVDEETQQLIAATKMMEKKCFKKQQTPNLLTWIEKETIRYLHRQDPVEWNAERLSESFPATPDSIKKVLRNKSLASPHVIVRADEDARNNWRLLAQGKLELDEEVRQHLKSSGSRDLGLDSSQRHLMELEVHKEHQESLRRVPKPAKRGEFASIIVDYRNKLKALNPEKMPATEVPQVLEMESLFGENTIPGTPGLNEPSPYGDTSLIRTSVDLSKEKKMDIEQFRRAYLENLRLGPAENETNQYRAKYLRWLKAEGDSQMRQTRRVPKIRPEEIASEAGAAQAEAEAGSQPGLDLRLGTSERTGAQELYTYDPEAGVKKLYVETDSPDRIEIPRDQYRRDAVYKYGDSVYDSNGEFMYRVPGLG